MSGEEAKTMEAADAEAAAAAKTEPREQHDEGAQGAIVNRAQSAADDDDDDDRASDVSSGQGAGETTDSAPPQAAGEEGGSEGLGEAAASGSPAAAGSEGDDDANGGHDRDGDAAAAPVSPPSPPEPALEPTISQGPAVGDDEKTAPLGESDNDDEDDAKSNAKAAALTKKKKSSRYEPPPPFVDDPSKVTLRFIFPNRDGLTVTVDCQPTDTVGEVKGMLLSMWPDGKFKLVLGLVGRGLQIREPDHRRHCTI